MRAEDRGILIALGLGLLFVHLAKRTNTTGTVSAELPAGGFPIFEGDCDKPNTRNWVYIALSHINGLIEQHNQQVRRDRRNGIINNGPLFARITGTCYNKSAADAWEFFSGSRSLFVDYQTEEIYPIN